MLLLLLLLGTALAYETFDGYQVLQIVPKTDKQLSMLKTLASDDRFVMMFQADFWREPSRVGRPVHVMLPGEGVDFVRSIIAEGDMVATEYITDVGSIIDTRYYERDDMSLLDYDYDDYQPYDDILLELEALAADCPAGFSCETYSIGQSVEGRDLVVLRVYQGSGRPAYWFDSLIHAREWLAGATHMQIIDTLIRGYGSDVDATALLDKYDFYFLPVMNPDGYSFTWTDNRMWRKNRGINAGSTCMGTDLNRNYDFQWGGVGTSANPCSETYGGSGGASEPETQVVQDEMARIGDSLQAWVSIHTYSQYWLNPWGDLSYDPDGDVMLAVSNAAADAAEDAHGDNWDRGNWGEVLYPSTGILQDYAKAIGGVRFTFTPELRDDGFGFTPPPSSIPTSYDEVWGALRAMIAAIEASKQQ